MMKRPVWKLLHFLINKLKILGAGIVTMYCTYNKLVIITANSSIVVVYDFV